MLKKITFAALFIIFGISVYFIFIFDINDYKSELETIISEKSNIITVITVETNPTKNSSEIPLAKKVFSILNSE